ncbi:MAG: hypothetical protein IJD59_01030 [Clostridia bacterium]|nr:hypothetical protein [Clostridia bacterium]
MEAKNKKDLWLIIIFSIVGGGISALSFFLYHYFENPLVTIMVCIADIVYAYFNAKFFLKSRDWNGVRQIFIPLMLLFYWVIIFAIICIGNALVLNGEFLNQFFIYPIFLMPSFVLVLLLFAVIVMGMGL